MSVRYAPGECFALVRPDVVVLVDGSVTAFTIAVLWDALVAAEDETDIAIVLDVVTSVLDPTLRALPDFALVVHHAVVDDSGEEEGVVHVAARGQMVVNLRTSIGSRTVTAPEMTTWSDQRVFGVHEYEAGPTGLGDAVGQAVFAIHEGIVKVSALRWKGEPIQPQAAEVSAVAPLPVLDDLVEPTLDRPIAAVLSAPVLPVPVLDAPAAPVLDAPVVPVLDEPATPFLVLGEPAAPKPTLDPVPPLAHESLGEAALHDVVAGLDAIEVVDPLPLFTLTDSGAQSIVLASGLTPAEEVESDFARTLGGVPDEWTQSAAKAEKADADEQPGGPAEGTGGPGAGPAASPEAGRPALPGAGSGAARLEPPADGGNAVHRLFRDADPAEPDQPMAPAAQVRAEGPRRAQGRRAMHADYLGYETSVPLAGERPAEAPAHAVGEGPSTAPTRVVDAPLADPPLVDPRLAVPPPPEVVAPAGTPDGAVGTMPLDYTIAYSQLSAFRHHDAPTDPPVGQQAVAYKSGPEAVEVTGPPLSAADPMGPVDLLAPPVPADDAPVTFEEQVLGHQTWPGFVDALSVEAHPVGATTDQVDLGLVPDSDAVPLSPLVEVTELAAESPDVVEVLARSCFFGHVNPPARTSCQHCGGGLSPSVQMVPRPSLGRVRFSTGEIVDLDMPMIVGRSPQRLPGQELTDEQVRLMAVRSPSQDISRSHLEVRLDGWNVVLVDLGTLNGSVLSRRGYPPYTLPADSPTLVVDADVIDLGDGIELTFEGLG